MVAPIIAGSVRVAKGAVRAGKNPAQTARKGRAAIRRPELLRRVSARERRNEREKKPLSGESKYTQQQNTKKILRMRRGLRGKVNKIAKHLPAEVSTNIKRVQAAAAAWAFVLGAVWFWLLQLVLWVLSLMMLGYELIPSIIDFPGAELYGLFYGLITLIGIGFMVAATVLFLIRGVSCFGGRKTLIFIACFAGHLVMIIHIFPFVCIWLASVVLLQDEEGEEETNPDNS